MRISYVVHIWHTNFNLNIFILNYFQFLNSTEQTLILIWILSFRFCKPRYLFDTDSKTDSTNNSWMNNDRQQKIHLIRWIIFTLSRAWIQINPLYFLIRFSCVSQYIREKDDKFRVNRTENTGGNRGNYDKNRNGERPGNCNEINQGSPGF